MERFRTSLVPHITRLIVSASASAPSTCPCCSRSLPGLCAGDVDTRAAQRRLLRAGQRRPLLAQLRTRVDADVAGADWGRLVERRKPQRRHGDPNTNIPDDAARRPRRWRSPPRGGDRPAGRGIRRRSASGRGIGDETGMPVNQGHLMSLIGPDAGLLPSVGVSFGSRL